MKNKLEIYCLIIVTWAGLSSCNLHSNYKLAQEEAKSRNAAIAEDNSIKGVNAARSSPGGTEEVLMDFVTNRNELVIRVRSGGCTQKDDFILSSYLAEKSNGDYPHYMLTVYRLRKDECKAFHPTGLLIKFNLNKELGFPISSTYSVTNKVEKGGSLSD
ncbi:MAG: hypothetical protein OEM02_15595 [Desulfobulbaceae bacterium]|nr:hypothetical protein [Desulfobulbaceae bacterium]